MGRIFQPARTLPGTVPEVRVRTITAAQSYKKGAVLIETAGPTGAISEASTDPTTILGVAAEDAFTKPGNEFGHSSQVLQVTGTINEASFFPANRSTVFSGRMVTTAGAIVTPALTDIGVNYGLVKVSNDWCVDQTETGTASVCIVDIDITEKIVYFKFLEAVLANP